MTLENRLVSTIIQYLWVKYPYQMKEIVIGHDKHLHLNPKKKKVIVEVSHAEG